MARCVEVLDDPEYSRRFPLERIARVRIEGESGEQLDSGEATVPWDEATSPPPTDDELRAKYRWLAGEGLPAARASEIEDAAWGCDGLPDAGVLRSLLAPPAGAERNMMGLSGGAERAIFGDLYLGSSPDDLAHQIADNKWLISLSAEESCTLTAGILRTFLERVIANRQQQLDRANADHGMILYAWCDEQARQLRFNLISDCNERLPFGCQLHVVDAPDAIIARCLECQQHGRILCLTGVGMSLSPPPPLEMIRNCPTSSRCTARICTQARRLREGADWTPLPLKHSRLKEGGPLARQHAEGERLHPLRRVARRLQLAEQPGASVTLGAWLGRRTCGRLCLTCHANEPYLRGMEVQLTPDQQALVRQAIESGRLHSEGAAVQEALSLWEDRERARAELIASLDEAEASIDRGEGRIVTRESMRELAAEVKRDVRARLAADTASAR